MGFPMVFPWVFPWVFRSARLPRLPWLGWPPGVVSGDFEMIKGDEPSIIAHDGSMVLLYMLTKMGYIEGIHVTIYSSTMDPMGCRNYSNYSNYI